MTAQEWIEARQEIRVLAQAERLRDWWRVVGPASGADAALADRRVCRRERARLERAERASAERALRERGED